MANNSLKGSKTLATTSDSVLKGIRPNVASPTRTGSGIWYDVKSIPRLSKVAASPGVTAKMNDIAQLRGDVDALRAAQTAHLNTLMHEALRLRSPIAVVVEYDADGFTARWTEALLEGSGSNVLEALQELREQIVDAYDDMRRLTEAGKQLVGYPATLWKLLAEFVEHAAAR